LTRHADITAPTDRVRCPIEQGDLSAAVCGQRHLAREWRGNRYLRVVVDLARYPSCAACPLGAVPMRASRYRELEPYCPRRRATRETVAAYLGRGAP
jgi:hypothetical protein